MKIGTVFSVNCSPDRKHVTIHLGKVLELYVRINGKGLSEGEINVHKISKVETHLPHS